MKQGMKIVLAMNALALIFLLIGLLLFNDISFTFIGLAIVLIGLSLNYYLRIKEKK